jgi:hypothetical protein
VECGGILTGFTAKEISEHTQRTWKRGHDVVLALREDMITMDGGGLAAADQHVPLKDGGVMMHKIGGTMHDTCNLANAMPKLISLNKCGMRVAMIFWCGSLT